MKKIKILIYAGISVEWEINNPIRNLKRNPHKQNGSSRTQNITLKAEVKGFIYSCKEYEKNAVHKINMQEKLIMKTPNLQIIGPEEGKYQLNGIDFIFKKIINKNFPNIRKNIGTQIQEAHKTPNTQELKRKF